MYYKLVLLIFTFVFYIHLICAQKSASIKQSDVNNNEKVTLREVFDSARKNLKSLKGDLKKEIKIRHFIRQVRRLRKKLTSYQLTSDESSMFGHLHQKLLKELTSLQSVIKSIRNRKLPNVIIKVPLMNMKKFSNRSKMVLKKLPKFPGAIKRQRKDRRLKMQEKLKNMVLMKKYPKTLDLNVKGESGNQCRMHKDCKPGILGLICFLTIIFWKVYTSSFRFVLSLASKFGIVQFNNLQGAQTGSWPSMPKFLPVHFRHELFQIIWQKGE